MLDNNNGQMNSERCESCQRLTKPKTKQEKIRILEQSIRDLSILNKSIKSLSRSTNLDTLQKAAIDVFLEATRLESCVLYLLNEDPSERVFSSNTGGDNELGEALRQIPITEGIPAKAIETRRVVTSQGVLRNLSAADSQGQSLESTDMGTLISLPLKSRDQIVGIITAGSQKKREFSNEDKSLFETLGCQIGSTIDHARLLDKMSRLSTVDELTGLYNRRYLEDVLETEIYRSQRCGHPFSLAMLDLDGFKNYNDEFGHQNGDRILQALARTLKLGLRKMDVACRYGGDEFSIVLPTTDALRAQRIVDRIRSMFLEVPEMQPGNIQSWPGISVGISQYPQASVIAQNLIFLADTALYYAKKNARNRTILISDLVIPAPPETSRESQEVYSLVNLVEAKEPSAPGHARNVSIISERLGKAIGLPANELLELRSAAFLHDIGKVRTPDSILTKPARLTKEEWEVLKNHPIEGARIVARVTELRKLAPTIKCHHERYDGTGYPSGLGGDKIPLYSRIIGIADAYDTMIHHRLYSEPMSSADALVEVRKCSGSQFDPQLANAFHGISSSLN